MKKLLVLGGKPIGSCEIVNYAKNNNIYTIVADYLPPEESKAKQLADEHWEISTADLEQLEKKAREAKIDGILTGVHGFNIMKMAQLAARMSLPCYCTVEQREIVSDKKSFKELCVKNGIRVSREYSLNPLTDDISEVEFPVIVKPADNGGSIGFSKCNNIDELKLGYEKALKNSPKGSVLIEEFIPYDSSIIHYTVINREIYFSGISDKISKKLNEDGSSVMALQLFPSKNIKEYLENMSEKVNSLFEDLNIENGPIWIEAFNNNGEFIFNEMGFRFGGSLTYYPVKYFYGFDQLKEMVHYSLGLSIERNKNKNIVNNKYSNYCILPIHIKAGTVHKVCGEDIIKDRDYIEAIVRVHYKGDIIENWGTAQQVFCYLHIKYNNIDELKKNMNFIKENYAVFDENENQMLFYLIDDSEF